MQKVVGSSPIIRFVEKPRNRGAFSFDPMNRFWRVNPSGTTIGYQLSRSPPERLGAAEDVRTDIALAVGEACANVVIHAYPPGDVGPLVVHAVQTRAGGPKLTVTVIDQGQGMAPRPDSPGLGLGLPLIANLADHLEIRDGPDGVGTEVVMVFSLKRDGDRPT